ncbi:MAG: bifunctional DNA-formamidopyrimidine glycosylase/DNA-(apurinic or apyrimidinic site) lyase [Gemmatimonadota bacterium]
MPELPEAETIARGLSPVLTGQIIAGVDVLHPERAVPEGRSFPEGLRGLRICGVGRRGKNVVISVEMEEPRYAAAPADRSTTHGGNGHSPILRLVVNLGMTGRLLWNPAPGLSRHPVARFRMAGSGVLVFDDSRRFGLLRLMPVAEWKKWNRALGPEPLSPGFTARRLEEALIRSRRPVHSWLLDQGKLAGVGNIYANEALFRARIHPGSTCESIPRRSVATLHRDLRRILRAAIQARGTTLQDYRGSDGAKGSFSSLLRVYGREAGPCPRCSAPVEKGVLGGRSVFWCPCCQPLFSPGP